MSGYNPDDLNAQEESAEEPNGEAEITDISETVASEVYGDNVDFDYDPTRVMIEVTALTTDGQEVEDTFALPDGEMSWYNPNFKLGNFKDKYGSVPQEGQTVNVTVDEDTGFIGIDY